MLQTKLRIMHTIMEPQWEPLKAALGKQHCEGFMFMASYVLEGGTTVHAYKHVISRGYLHLSDDGRAWTYVGGAYMEADRELEIKKVLEEILKFS